MPSTTSTRLILRGVTLAALALVGACGGESGSPTGPGPAPLGIDFCGGALYGVGSDSRAYTMDTLSGAATAVGGAFAPGPSGAHFGLAYDAAAGRLHLTGVESNQIHTLDPATGAAARSVAEMAYGAGDTHAGTDPALSAAAYLGATLYGIETNANSLVTVSPASGELTTVADLPFNVYICSGMDVDTDGKAYAALADGQRIGAVHHQPPERCDDAAGSDRRVAGAQHRAAAVAHHTPCIMKGTTFRVVPFGLLAGPSVAGAPSG